MNLEIYIKIHKNTYIEYDYQTYKNSVLDRINKKEVSTSNDGSIINEVGKTIFSAMLHSYRVLSAHYDSATFIERYCAHCAGDILQ